VWVVVVVVVASEPEARVGSANRQQTPHQVRNLGWAGLRSRLGRSWPCRATYLPTEVRCGADVIGTTRCGACASYSVPYLTSHFAHFQGCMERVCMGAAAMQAGSPVYLA